MESISNVKRWHSFVLYKELLFSSVNLETTDLCRDYFCLSQGSASLQQEFDFSLFYWLLQDLSDCWRQAPIHIKVSCRYWKWKIGEGPNISCQVLNSNPFFLPLMLNIYFVCSVRGKDSHSVTWFGWALPPRLVTLGWSICFPKPLLSTSAKAISLQGLVKSRLRQAMALNNSLVLKRSKIPDITRFLVSPALHTTRWQKPPLCPTPVQDTSGVPGCKMFYNSY